MSQCWDPGTLVGSKEVATMQAARRYRSLVGIAATLMLIGVTAVSPVLAAETDVADHLPANPHLAGVYTFDPVEIRKRLSQHMAIEKEQGIEGAILRRGRDSSMHG